jgi:hypothetical protein
MEVTVRTGQTKPSSGTHVVSKSLVSAAGDQVCFLLQIHASQEEAKVLENECNKVLQHSLLQADGDPWTRLDGTLKELNGLMKGMMAAHALGEVHALIALLEGGNTLHVATAGRAEAYLIRAGQTSQVTETSRGKPVPAFVQISSGKLESRDAVVLATQRLLRTVTPAQLSQLAAQRGEHLLQELTILLDGERESAGLGVLHIGAIAAEEPPVAVKLPSRRTQRSSTRIDVFATLRNSAGKVRGMIPGSVKAPDMRKMAALVPAIRERAMDFLADLKHPERKRRAHLLLLAGAAALFLIVWATVQLSTMGQRSKTRAELQQLMEQIGNDLKTAENRRLTGDIDAVNSILQRSEERAKQVMDNESGLFRVEALNLLDQIQVKREEVNNIVRLSPRVAGNLAAKKSDIDALGMIGDGDGEFTVYDRQSLYRVVQNFVDDPQKITEEDLLQQGVGFSRYRTLVFTTTGNSVIEIINDQAMPMKTDDPAGWVIGKDIETYLRYLYVLVPEKNQIQKYERLNNRYGPGVGYNINGDLSNALDMAIDTNIFVLKGGGKVVKLLRGETQPFSIRHAPDNVLADATKVYKVPGGNLYFLDPKKSRVIVVTEGGATGESTYVKQYVLEGDTIATLKDLFVDAEQTHLYVLDGKHVYVVDLANK